MRQVDGPVAIGHVRYATCGGNDRSDAQPFERDHGRKAKWFAFAFNGQLANYEELKEELLDKGDYHLKRNTDTEIIMHSLAYELQTEDQEPDWVGVFGRIAERFDGAYNIVLITAHGELVVVRDPLGFRPLCIAEHGPLFAAASESVPLANLGFRNIRSLEPGTLVVANHKGVRIERFAPSPRQAHCFFEWIYFANVASTLDDRSVYLSRAALGKELARLEDVPLDADTIVVPVPDTAKAAADAMAFALGVPSVEGLMRNRYVGRTFIEGTADRAAKARLKYTPLPEVLAGKRVLLVEDSIVRSTTMRALVHEIRDRGGAREIHLRVACPPIIAPCYYGIDMSRKDELFATPYHRRGRRRRLRGRPAAHGPGAGRRQPALPARRGDRAVGQPLARSSLPRLHHRPLSHRDRPGSLPDRKQPLRRCPRTGHGRPGLRAGLTANRITRQAAKTQKRITQTNQRADCGITIKRSPCILSAWRLCGFA